eukprot:TRINITY_DN9654_c0_g1_i1.p1 TRINITY_DN9654_c0_g1~~TRINITY_DN9654_c0_g1_i1.p1  ORF type:complete len:207 (+),score=26.71 TRINITY_DN9654_c0_g1_i1:47-667(+)
MDLFKKKKSLKKRPSDKQNPIRSDTEKYPKLWPRTIFYTRGVVMDIMEAEHSEEVIPMMRSYFKLKKLKPRHPGYNRGHSLGLFATKFIKAGSILGEYTGVITFGDISDTRYCLESAFNASIDAKWAGNEMRFINDYRGVAECENTVFTTVSSWKRFLPDGTSNGSGILLSDPNSHSVVKATQDIYPKEEILVDYGEGYCRSFGII